MTYTYNYPMASLTSDVVMVCNLLKPKLTLFGSNKKLLRGCYVLLVERKIEPYAGSYVLPGGHVNIGKGETSLQAAIRELKEETDLSYVPLLTKLNSYSRPERDPRGRYVTEVFGTVMEQDLLPSVNGGDDAYSAQWVNIKIALLMDLGFDHKQILADSLLKLNISKASENMNIKDLISDIANIYDNQNFIKELKSIT